MTDAGHERIPGIRWREPIMVATPTASGWACRLCIAAYGLRAQDVGRLFATPDEHAAHLAEFHSPETRSSGT